MDGSLVRGFAVPGLNGCRVRLELAVEDEGEVTFDALPEDDVFDLSMSRSRWVGLGCPKELSVMVVCA